MLVVVAADRAVLIRYWRDGGPRRGSGLQIGGRFVLTADHCANGTDHRVVVESHEWPAKVHVRSNTTDVDLAVLAVPGLPELDWLGCALVNRVEATHLEQCQALGFPQWKGTAINPVLAQARGDIPTVEGRDPAAGSFEYLSLKITDPEALGQPIARGDLEHPGSVWAGMSGAVVITLDGVVVGVVRSHAFPEGPRSLTITPLETIDRLPRSVAGQIWAAIGVTRPDKLPRLPPAVIKDPTSRRLNRIRDLEAGGLLYREASVQLQIQAVLMEFQGDLR